MRNLTIALILLLSATALFAADNAGTTSGAFLGLGLGARPLALGNAFVAVADDGSALFFNPAGLATLQKPELQSMYTNWFVDTKYGALSLAAPGFAFAAAYLDYGRINETTLAQPGGTGGSFSSGALCYRFGFGKNVSPLFAWGLGLKLFGEYLGSSDAAGYGVDAGLLWQLPERNMSIGLAATNLLGQFAGEISRSLTLGIAAQFAAFRPAFDLCYATDYGLRTRAGVEMDINGMLYPRCGYDSGKVSLGFGLLLSRVGFDYAYLSAGDLGATHRFSLKI